MPATTRKLTASEIENREIRSNGARVEYGWSVQFAARAGEAAYNAAIRRGETPELACEASRLAHAYWMDIADAKLAATLAAINR